MFITGLSLLTSAATLWVIYHYRSREDALLSHDAAMEEVIADMFHLNQVCFETLPTGAEKINIEESEHAGKYDLSSTQRFALHQLQTLQQARDDTGGYLPYPPLMKFVDTYEQLVRDSRKKKKPSIPRIDLSRDNDSPH